MPADWNDSQLHEFGSEALYAPVPCTLRSRRRDARNRRNLHPGLRKYGCRRRCQPHDRRHTQMRRSENPLDSERPGDDATYLMSGAGRCPNIGHFAASALNSCMATRILRHRINLTLSPGIRLFSLRSMRLDGKSPALAIARARPRASILI